MTGLEPIARVLVGVGVSLVLLGAVVWVLSRSSLLGQLPGDIRVEGDGFTCLIPLVSSIILSVLFTALLNLVIWWINR